MSSAFVNQALRPRSYATNSAGAMCHLGPTLVLYQAGNKTACRGSCLNLKQLFLAANLHKQTLSVPLRSNYQPWMQPHTDAAASI